ncbi:MAG TPA: amylo-alpha-1,6-glucosidase [Bryobacteraceae bacterium]|nr:amylo-alpha-1,6-glucosidase [Bryobacteraceae bacterium]
MRSWRWKRSLNFPADLLNDEWLETNGIGGFASATISGLNSRRYHGLLVAALDIPVRRAVLLSKMEETLVANGERFELSTNQYAGALHPTGYRYLGSYETVPCPTFRFQTDLVTLEKRVFLVHGENTVVLSYELGNEPGAGGEYSLELRPLLAFRDYHATTHANPAFRREFEEDEEGVIRLRPYPDLPDFYISHNGCFAEATGNWYYNFEYVREQERGFFDCEDLFQPFVIRCRLKPGQTVHMVASTRRRTASEAESLYQAELERRSGMAAVLTKDADQFIVRRGNGHTVIAGYHWFTDWGRDTMISLPGLTLCTGRYEIAREILQTFAANASQGMIPNRFGDASGAPEWNTVDGALWMFEAARCYLEERGDWEFVKEKLYPVLQDMVAWHRRGTRYGIHMTTDGLLSAGDGLTWMDARVDGRAVTPRDGKAVEIQALWFNALSTLHSFAERWGENEYAAELATLLALTRKSFFDQFWNEKAGCLFDVVRNGRPDASIRPNQIFAVSLAYPLVEGAAAKQIVGVVRRDLLTPRGLRTLSPGDAAYRGRYGGDSFSRDSAYHQGTVWPWLAGPFWAAWLKVHSYSAESKATATRWLEDFAPHLHEAGIGQVSEVFSGDAPHEPGGCIAQAWSVAELLRLSRLLEK